MDDEFPSKVARSNYDQNAFYVDSQDSKGHYERKYVKFPPDIWYRICAVAASRDNPFRNPNDVIRNAVVHQLNRDASLDDADPAFVQYVAEMTAMAILETEIAVIEHRKKLLSIAKKVAEEASATTAAEKSRLIALLRLQTIGVSEEVKREITNLVKRHEK